MLRDALGYPVRGPHAERVLLVGFGLVLAAAVALRFPLPASLAALLPGLVLLGYFARVLEATVAGDGEPPAYGRLGGLLKRAAVVLAVAVAYVAVPVGYFLVAVAGGLFAGVPVGSSGSVPPAVTLFGTVGLMLALAAAYALPVAAALALASGSLRTAFALRTVLGLALSRPFPVAWGLAVAAAVAAAMVGGALARAGAVGEVVAFAASYYLALVATRLLGRGVAAADRA